MCKDVQAVKANHALAAFQHGGGIVSFVVLQNPQKLLVIVTVPVALGAILLFISVKLDHLWQETLATLQKPLQTGSLVGCHEYVLLLCCV